MVDVLYVYLDAVVDLLMVSSCIDMGSFKLVATTFNANNPTYVYAVDEHKVTNRCDIILEVVQVHFQSVGRDYLPTHSSYAVDLYGVRDHLPRYYPCIVPYVGEQNNSVVYAYYAQMEPCIS